MSVPCSCGHQEAHIIARRRTADGRDVVLWSDGPVTGWFGHALPGVPIARPRSEAALALALCAGRLFMGEVCIHDADDLGDLYAACRWAAARDRLPGTVRARLAEMRTPRLTPVWTVLTADRDGRPRERVWRLPRMRWPGLAVWDHCTGGRGGRYEIVASVSGSRDSTWQSAGIRFRTVAEVADHLLDVAQRAGQDRRVRPAAVGLTPDPAAHQTTRRVFDTDLTPADPDGSTIYPRK